MVISKGFSLITNALLDENRLQSLDDIGMEKKTEKRDRSGQGPDVEDIKDDLNQPDGDDSSSEDLPNKDKIQKGYGFSKVNCMYNI